LNGAAALAGDDTPPVLEVVTAGLERVEEYIANDENRSAYHQWVAEILTPALSRIDSSESRSGRSSDAGRQRQLETRALLLHALGFAARDGEILDDARRRVREYLQHDGEIEPALRTTLVNLAALAGDAELYEHYVVRSREGSTPEERYRFLYGLARFRDPALLRRTVEYAFSEHVRTQDVALLLGAVLDNPAGRDLAWTAIRERWPELHDRLGGFGGTTRLISALSAFCEQTKAREIERFFTGHSTGEASRTLAQTIDRIETCAAMTRTQSPKLTAWVDDRPPS
jgi:aminopeptidase N/puromycin-sensitive aminopeptidase